MRIDAEDRLADVFALNEQTGPVFKAKDDPRITRVGRILRRCSIDEMPQLFHVLSGSMSLVEIVEAQRSGWFILVQPVGVIIFWIATVAEVNRHPFDMPEAEQEIVAGYRWQGEVLRQPQVAVARPATGSRHNPVP